ncbi:MAG TPA: DinB family protein [Pseudobacteroides sp.]|nr:DinB family protein [Pseudobacteroides sp.]
MKGKTFDLKELLKRHFDPSFEMLEKMIQQCPDELWTQVNGGFPFWQQIFHTYESIDYWMRKTDENYEEPIYDKDVTFDLNKTCSDYLSKDELMTYSKKIRKKVERFFNELESQDFLKLSNGNDIFTYSDKVLVQIRHIQYHIGHCNSILRNHKYDAVKWIGYGEN